MSNERNSIQLLDCTLRDGGYVNDWRFGDKNACNIVDLTLASGVDYTELAFIRDCKYERGKLEFSDMTQIANLFCPYGKPLSAMVEIGYGYPVSAFPECSANTVKLVRLVVWKRMIPESVEYARALLDKGYEVAIQATRIEQYDMEEFKDFIKAFSALKLKAIYIVDTFGLLTKEILLDYASVADKELPDGIRIGYHAHNNMQQACCNAMAIVEHPWRHGLMIDASVMGIGRGAGNLCLELFEKYLNERHCGKYDLAPLLECAELYIEPIYRSSPWGYSIPYMLSAKHGCNPSYVHVLEQMNASIRDMDTVFGIMRERGCGIRFDAEMCGRVMAEVREKGML